MAGAPIKEQVADAVLDTEVPVQLSLPVAVTVLLTEQVSTGLVKVVVKLTEAPGKIVSGPITGVLAEGWLLTTNTLTSVTLPELPTVPV
jgi:hypothetical protein